MNYTPDKILNVKKIAVLRANALGDFIVTLPALKALRENYPEAEIVLLGAPWHKAFLVSGRSPVDRVIVVPIKQGIRNQQGKTEDPNEITLFTEAIQKEQFDIIINFQGSGVSANPFIKSFHAKLTVGLWSEGAEKLDVNLDYYYYQSEALRYLELVKLIGATTADIEPTINVLEQDAQEIQSILKHLVDKPFIVLHPMALDIRRMWPIEHYAGLADQLKQQNFEVVFTGSPEDSKAVDSIISNMKSTAINACGSTLGGLIGLLSKAALVIGADTGPLHLARAVNAKTIGFYWAPNLINWAPLLRGNHRPLISWQMACPLCGTVPNNPYPFEPQNGCNHLVSFVRDITIQQVMEAVDSFMLSYAEDRKNERTIYWMKREEVKSLISKR